MLAFEDADFDTSLCRTANHSTFFATITFGKIRDTAIIKHNQEKLDS